MCNSFFQQAGGKESRKEEKIVVLNGNETIKKLQLHSIKSYQLD